MRDTLGRFIDSKGENNAFFGRTHSEVAKEKMRLAKLGKSGPTANRWEGDEVKYSGLHMWVRKYLGTPDTCKHCGRSGLRGHSIHWANKSKRYLRDLADWVRLCAQCHRDFDKRITSNNV